MSDENISIVSIIEFIFAIIITGLFLYFTGALKYYIYINLFLIGVYCLLNINEIIDSVISILIKITRSMKEYFND